MLAKCLMMLVIFHSVIREELEYPANAHVADIVIRVPENVNRGIFSVAIKDYQAVAVTEAHLEWWRGWRRRVILGWKANCAFFQSNKVIPHHLEMDFKPGSARKSLINR